MSKWKDVFFKQETGQTLKQWTRRQTARQVIDAIVEEEQSPYPPRYIADNDEAGRIYLYEHDRTQNTHILGTTEQGKSKLLEMLMSMDIHMLMDKTLNYNAGFCFIDSTEHGKTLYKVLRYCIKKGFDKILLIDPHHINSQDYGYTVPINPLDYHAPAEAMTSHIADSLRVVWSTKDFRDESVITKYSPYLIEALHFGRYTLPDIECFAVPALANQREQILSATRTYDGKEHNLPFVTRAEVERIYKDKAVWTDVQPTFRRFEPYRHSIMKRMFGSSVGVDFQKLIKEGWIILCNLHHAGVYDVQHQKLLGTTLINEIIRAKQRMKGHTVPYHIYIDEFGHYATSKIEQILMYERHLHIYLTLSHQGFFQINDPRVKSAVRAGCKCKVLFHTPEDEDLYAMIGLMYGGNITDREVKYVLQQLKQRQAAIKINKQPARICDLRNWPDVTIPQSQVRDFILTLYKSNPQLYRPSAEVWGEIKNKFAVLTTSAGTAPKDRQPAQGSNEPKGTTGEPSAKPRSREDKAKPKRKSVFDNLSGS